MIGNTRYSSIVLGSSSPRRKQLISSLGISFRVISPLINEPEPIIDEFPSVYCERMALLKSNSIKHLVSPSECLITSDTVVSLGKNILGKPKDPIEAEYMLKMLRGKTHKVLTSVILFSPFKNKIRKTIKITHVNMRNYSNLEISTYINSGDWMGKAGSYSIQNKDFKLSQDIDGCYTAVVGLPLCDVISMLIKENFNLDEVICSKGLDKSCL